MEVILHEHDKYILRFDRDAEVISSLRQFCEEQGIKSGFFWGIGAIYDVVLSIYDLKKKQYTDKIFNTEMEIAAFHGNIATLQTKVVLHAHGSFSDNNFQTFSGHVEKMIVWATCELIITVLNGNLERKYDLETGLNLLTAKDEL